jgi:CheY-like chemotaxis protein
LLPGSVLLAEDGPDNQRLIAHILGKAGAEVTVVDNGKKAVDAARDAVKAGHPFNLILMDMQMPVMDGYEATTTLREEGYTGWIVALTAHAMASDRQKCINAGCNDYATKPIQRKEFFATLAKYIGEGTHATRG